MPMIQQWELHATPECRDAHVNVVCAKNKTNGTFTSKVCKTPSRYAKLS